MIAYQMLCLPMGDRIVYCDAPVKLSPETLEFLRYLHDNPGRLDEIFDKIQEQARGER